MATIVAQANGNFSNTATWTGGVVPGAGDIAQTGNYAVTIDASVTCTLNPTGSGRFDVTTGGITITGDLVMQSSYTGGGLRCQHNSGAVALTGTATGGAGGSSLGAANAGAGTMTVGTATGGAGSYSYGAHNSAAGTLTVGTATGGAGNGAYGAYNGAAGTLTVGTATGGAGANAYGAYNAAAGTLTVGTATGGAGNGAYGAHNNAAGTLTCDLAIGSNWGPGGTGNLNPGVYGTGVIGQTTKVKRVQSGAYGAPGIWGFVLIEPDASNSAQFRLTPGGSTLTLVDAAAAADFPDVANVRSGVTFDNGDKVGTCAVPGASEVAYGVPVDNTTGTAVLTAAGVTAAVWDAARSGHATDGTFGDTAEWAGSVDEAAIAAAVWDAALSGHTIPGSTGAGIAAAGNAGDPWATELPGAYGAGTAGALLSGIDSSVDEAAIAAAVLAAANTTPIKAALAASQGAVTFGQVKILADINYEGALHVENNALNGVGLFAHGTLIGQHNHGNQSGQYNNGGTYGQNNYGDDAGQYNNGKYMGQYNQGDTYGQNNYGDDAGQYNEGDIPVVGAASQEIADALKRAPAAGTPAAGSVYDLLGDVSIDPQAVGDAVLLRDWEDITGSVPDRSALNALRFLRNRWAASGGALTVYKEDDTTVAWEALLTTNSNSDRITGSTPE